MYDFLFIVDTVQRLERETNAAGGAAGPRVGTIGARIILRQAEIDRDAWRGLEQLAQSSACADSVRQMRNALRLG